MPAPLFQILIDGEAVEPRLMSSVRRMEVRESDEEASMAALRLQLAQLPSGEYYPLDEDIFSPGVRISIELAAPGGNPVRLFEGFATHVRPHFEPIESNCYLEVMAMDCAILMDAHERTTSYPDMSDSDAAGQVMAAYGITAEVKDTEENHKADYQLLVQRATDWEFLRGMARRNGYICYFEPDPAGGPVKGYFGRRDLEGDPQADLTVLQQGANLRWLDAQFVSTGPVRRSGAAIDAIRKRIVTSDGEPALPALGNDGLADSIEQALKEAGATGATRLLRDTRPTDMGLKADAVGATDEARFSIEVRGELDPSLYRGLLRARRTVLIKGAGARFSGLYYVTTVRSVVDDGALAQTFVAIRNAFGQTGREEFGKQAEEVPAQ